MSQVRVNTEENRNEPQFFGIELKEKLRIRNKFYALTVHSACYVLVLLSKLRRNFVYDLHMYIFIEQWNNVKLSYDSKNVNNQLQKTWLGHTTFLSGHWHWPLTHSYFKCWWLFLYLYRLISNMPGQIREIWWIESHF